MENDKRTCNQICHWNDSSDGCVKPYGRNCPMSNTEPDASGWGQVQVANEKRLIEIPSDGIIIVQIMRGCDTVGERKVDLSHYPTVDAVEVVHGRWEQVGDYYVCGDYCYRCTNCMTDEWMTFGHMKRFIYCPFCGAKMDGDDNGM